MTHRGPHIERGRVAIDHQAPLILMPETDFYIPATGPTRTKAQFEA